MAKTPKRIMDLAENTLAGHRGGDHQEFRAVVEANGYVMSRGGWVKFGGETVCHGWEAFAYMVFGTQEITLHEPKAIAELEDIEESEAEEMAKETPYLYHPTRGLIPEVDAILDKREAEASETVPPTVEVSYLYATRVPTVRLSGMTMVQILITEDRPNMEIGDCESGAALACLKTGVRRILPESLLPGSEREEMIQCAPCFEVSAAAYSRKLHHYTGTEAQ